MQWKKARFTRAEAVYHESWAHSRCCYESVWTQNALVTMEFLHQQRCSPLEICCSHHRFPSTITDNVVRNCVVGPHQSTFKNTVFLSGKLCSMGSYNHLLTVTSVYPHFNRRIWPVSIYCGRPLALGYYRIHQHQHVRLFLTSTADAPVSMSGRVTVDDSTSEALFWMGL